MEQSFEPTRFGIARFAAAGGMRFGARFRRAMVLWWLALAGAAAAEPGIAPRLEAAMLDGTAFSLADSRGSVVAVMVWSPTSLASRKSLPEWQRFHSAFSKRGAVILALSAVDDTKEIRRVAEARGVQAPLGVLGLHELGPLSEARLPAIRVFDRAGRLVATHDGLFRLRDVQRDVEALLER